METSVFPDAHDGGETQRSLVDGLDEVSGDHDGEHSLIDQPAQTSVLLFRDLEGFISDILG